MWTFIEKNMFLSLFVQAVEQSVTLKVTWSQNDINKKILDFYFKYESAKKKFCDFCDLV